MYDPEDLRPGDIILCEGELDVRDPLGLIIMWASDNRFQHAALVGDGEILEAIDEVTAAPLHQYAPVGWRYEVAGATEAQREAAVAAARRRLGEVYTCRSLGRVPLYRRLDPHDVVSSGLVTWAFAQAGIRLTWEPLPTPASLSYSPLLIGPRPW
jgi:cell wall-associated NlpC family hydrolase